MPAALVRLQRIRAARPPAASLALARGFLGRRQIDYLAQVREAPGLVGNRHGLDEVVLKARLDGGLHFLDAPDQGFDDAAGGRIQEGDGRAGSGGIAGRTYLVEIAVGNHPENRRVLDVDVAAEGSGEPDTI